MNDHVAEPFRSILNTFAGEKPSLQNQHIAPRTATGRDLLRSRALQAGYDAIVGLDPEPTLSYYDFVEGVKAYEAKLAEQHLDRQYAYEQKRTAPLYIPAGEEAARVTYPGDVERAREGK